MPAVLREPGDRLVVERPQRVGGGRLVVAGGEHAVLVALGDEHQRPVDRHDLVEEHRDVHRARLGHAVVARPGAVILVPLPDLAVERRLGVDLELVHVDRLAEQLLDRLDQARVGAEEAERLVVGMGRERGARRAGLLAPDLLAVLAVDRLGLGAQDRRPPPRRSSWAGRVALLGRTPSNCCGVSFIGRLLRRALFCGSRPLPRPVGKRLDAVVICWERGRRAAAAKFRAPARRSRPDIRAASASSMCGSIDAPRCVSKMVLAVSRARFAAMVLKSRW